MKSSSAASRPEPPLNVDVFRIRPLAPAAVVQFTPHVSFGQSGLPRKSPVHMAAFHDPCLPSSKKKAIHRRLKDPMHTLVRSTNCRTHRAIDLQLSSATFGDFRLGSQELSGASSFDISASTLSLLQDVRSGTTVALKIGWGPGRALREQTEWRAMNLRWLA